MLQVDRLSVAYGGLAALREVTIAVDRGRLVAVIGANGAGKTTLFKAISGVVPAGSGSIRFDGRDLATLGPAERARLGIAHVPEGRQVFGSMSVLENLELGAYRSAARGRLRENLELVYGLFPVLHEFRGRLAGSLSGGQQQMLAIGRALAADPSLLMLDEPSMGLAPAVVEQIFESILALHRERGLTILLVEQRAAEALDSCDSGYVLETGKIVLQGSGAVLRADPQVREAYLGLA